MECSAGRDVAVSTRYPITFFAETGEFADYFLVTRQYTSPAPRSQLMSLITSLPSGMFAIVADRRDTGFKSVPLMTTLNLTTAHVSNAPLVFLVRS